MAADGFIVGYLRSIAVLISKMQDQQSLTLRWLPVDSQLTLISGHGNNLILRVFA